MFHDGGRGKRRRRAAGFLSGDLPKSVCRRRQAPRRVSGRCRQMEEDLAAGLSVLRRRHHQRGRAASLHGRQELQARRRRQHRGGPPGALYGCRDRLASGRFDLQLLDVERTLRRYLLQRFDDQRERRRGGHASGAARRRDVHDIALRHRHEIAPGQCRQLPLTQCLLVDEGKAPDVIEALELIGVNPRCIETGAVIRRVLVSVGQVCLQQAQLQGIPLGSGLGFERLIPVFLIAGGNWELLYWWHGDACYCDCY